MSKFFINRPIVAMVISIVMVLVGSLTILTLPVAQFPNIKAGAAGPRLVTLSDPWADRLSGR